MRHGKKINHLGRKSAHRHALLSNMASSLIINKRITTTVAKAKALRKYVEPLLTRSKDDTTHSRRTVFSYLQNKESVQTLFGEVASKIGDRPGGYTRIIKMGDVRLGDNAEMCLIELVDFNTLYTKDGVAKKAKTRRSRRGGKKDDATDAEVVSETPEAEAPAKAKPAAKAKKSEDAPKKAAAPKKTATKKPKDKE
jgi:large subunit ribosomal protein L17